MQYSFAIATTAATLGVRLALDAPLGGQPNLVIFTIPIMLSAYVAGLRAGLMATAASYLAATYFLLPPIHSLAVASPVERWQQGLIAVAGVLISVLNEGLHRARRRAEVAQHENRQAEKRTQDLLRELEAERARLVVAQSVASVGSWETDLTTLAVIWSDETYRIFETTREAFRPTHQGFLEFVHPDDRARVDAAILQSKGAVGPLAMEHRLLLADGRVKYVEERWQSFSDALGQPLRAFGTCQDVSVRKHAQMALAESSQGLERRERMLDTTLSSMADFAYTFDRDGRFLFVNQPLLDLWGIRLEEAVGKNFFELGYPDELAHRLQRQLQEVFETKRILRDETAYTSPSGVDGFFEYIFAPVLGPDGEADVVVGSTRNITEHKRTAAALRTSMEEFRALAESIPQMVWIARADGWCTYVSQQWMDYTGLTLAEGIGHGWNKPFHPEDQQRALDVWQEATETLGRYSIECRLRRADGVYRWWLVRAVPVRGADGALGKWFGTCTDIHDLKVAEIEISRSKERFATVFQSNLIALAIAEMESGCFVDVNNHAAELFGYTRAEMIGRTPSELRLWADPIVGERMLKDLAAGNAPSRQEASFRRKSGEICHALISLETLTLTGTTEALVLAGIVDITERKRLEGQLLQAQKMEAVGRLAGGVAHDFNNSLGVILGYTELLLRQPAEGQRAKLEQILKATERASGLTRQLLAFSRKQVAEPRVLDLSALLTELERMLGRLIGEDIDLAILSNVGVGHVKADPGQLEQVVMNLCVNARDAMPGGGLLRIEVANVDLEAGELALQEPATAGRYVMLSVGDTGSGIEKAVLAQIFEPFFTTKEEGKGTGLGLAMVYGIVTQSGGHVSVDSEVGRGTTFRIYLPRIDAPVAAPEVRESSSLARGSETLLLVEDEGALREIACEVLQAHGYRVITANGPQEAIDIAGSNPERIHLLVTDVVMPVMNGRMLASRLVAARPSLRVLYMSGYTDDVITQSGVLEEGTLLLEKPFTVQALLARVRDALADQETGVKA